jgi:DNA polymerase III alpha subunit
MKIPKDPKYKHRLKQELELIKKFRFRKTFKYVQEISQLCSDIPFMIRGSAGASLILHLMGINNIDPIKEDIPLCRFMHAERPDLPDIDLDFPSNRRDEAYERIFQKWPRRVARLSSIMHYGQIGAAREALRRMGYPNIKNKDVQNLPYDTRTKAYQLAQTLVGQPYCYNKHCGGILIYDQDIPPEHLLNPTQVKLDKYEAEKQGLIKIDILSNHALAQLYEIDPKPFDQYPETDQKTQQLLAKGDTIGVTFAESPAFRKMLKQLKPKNAQDMIFAMALIRPAAAYQGKKKQIIETYHTYGNKRIVFDEDAIKMIMKTINCTESQAEKIRKGFSKRDPKIIQWFSQRTTDPNTIKDLQYMRMHSWCKAHAINYGKLVWALAYQKAHNRQKFWKSTLKHCVSSYKKWVHIWFATKDGLIQPSTQLFHDPLSELKSIGYWTSPDFIEGTFFDGNRIRGIIANYRKQENLTYITLGIDGDLFDFVCYDKIDTDLVFLSGLIQDDTLMLTS